jgi:response regulator RpfG family c-di-GMP phosphodiesterase
MPTDGTLLRALIVEDNPDDAILVARALQGAGFHVEHERVDAEAPLRRAIQDDRWDVVIADYRLPSFTGPEAYHIVRECRAHVPFILVSGAVGEEIVVEAMRQGIDDYLMKDNLRRLPAAVERAIETSRERKRRQTAEADLRHSDAILQAIGLAAKRLLASPEWRLEIREVLAELGRSTAVSRVYLFSIRNEGGVHATQEAEWVGPGVSPRESNPEFTDFDMEANGFEPWAAALMQGRPVYGLVRDFPTDIRAHLEKWDVASIAVVPIMVEGVWWGTFGFDVCGSLRVWSTAEIEALKIAADTVGAAIKRAEDRMNLRRQLKHLQALRTIDRAIASSLDLELTLSVVLDQVTAELEVDAASILLQHPITGHFECTAARGIFDARFRAASVRAGEGLAGKAALERRPAFVPDLSSATEGSREALLPRGFVSYYALPLIAKNEVKGVLETFRSRPLEPGDEWRDFAATLAGQAAIAIDNAQMLLDLTHSNNELRLAYETTLDGWSRALDLRDNDTQGHTERVAALAVRLARAMGMEENAIIHLRRGALLHDIGKMGIPDSILLKPGPLDDEEWAIMRRHPVYAHELLSPIPYLRPALDIPHLHHERWDGSGYPLGLKGEEIPLAARVFAVVDVWDALISRRPYRSNVREERAREIIRDGAGTDFDPRVVEAFLKLDIGFGDDAQPRVMSR